MAKCDGSGSVGYDVVSQPIAESCTLPLRHNQMSLLENCRRKCDATLSAVLIITHKCMQQPVLRGKISDIKMKGV